MELLARTIWLAHERPELQPHLLPMIREAGWGGSGFGGTLSEPTSKGPGDNARRVAKGEELHGWDKYAQIVAEAFQQAPTRDGQGVKAFIALKMHILKMFQRIQSKVEVKWVDYDPYASATEMEQKVRSTGVLEISSQFNQTEAFGPEGNLMLRAVHDFAAHLGAAPGNKPARAFSLKGELQAYNTHAALVHCGSPAGSALFTEIVAQTCFFNHFGGFPKQKITILDQFDHCKIGRVTGYRIVDGDLVR